MNDKIKQKSTTKDDEMTRESEGGVSQGKKGGQTDQGTELEDLSEEDADAISGNE